MNIEQVTNVYKVHNVEVNKIKTFSDFDGAEKFVDERQSSFDNIYNLVRQDNDGVDTLSFHMMQAYEKGDEHTTGYDINGKFDNGAWVFKWVGKTDMRESEWFSSMNKAIKSALSDLDFQIQAEQETYYQEMSDAFFGKSECSTCRGGGCVHCEPHRFI